MYCEYEGDVLCQSVTSHLYKSVSSGRARLTFKHVHTSWQCHLTKAPRLCCRQGPKCAIMNGHVVGGSTIRRAIKMNSVGARTLKPRPGGASSYLHMQIVVTPDPCSHQEKPIKILIISCLP